MDGTGKEVVQTEYFLFIKRSVLNLFHVRLLMYVFLVLPKCQLSHHWMFVWCEHVQSTQHFHEQNDLNLSRFYYGF
jgi:hypothetical protein